MNSSTDQKPRPSEYQDNLEIIMQIPMFSGLPLEPLKVLTFLARRETFKPGEFLFRRHEVDSNAYFIVEGSASATFGEEEQSAIRAYGAGDFIGGLSLFAEMKRLFSLKADSRTTCLILSGEKFRKTLEQFPEISPLMLRSVVRTILDWESRFVNEHTLECEQCRAGIGVSLT